MSNAEMDEVVREFLVESHENLDRLDRGFLVLEKDPGDEQVLASIFRTIHTIKGTAGFLGFSRLEALTHAGESLLSRLREGSLRLDTAMTNALLAMVDAVRVMLRHVEADGGEGEVDCTALVQTLTRLQSPEPVAPASSSEPAPHVVPVAPVSAQPAAEAHSEPSPVPAAPEPNPVLPISAALNDVLELGGSGVADNSIRVDVGLLDKLMNLVGELVLARNQVLQFTVHAHNTTLAATSQRLDLITTELQEGVMKTRMQPIGNVWSKFPRVVRDLAAACGKEVTIDMQGRETDLDRTIIEAIKDPLTHLVRNAVDHGIESAAERTARGKAAAGRLLLRAFHEGGQVNIEISDDGGGIDLERVKAKALARGLLTHEQAQRMSDREMMGVIFLPGFSTAERLSNISGRGVGMDVVKTNIERIGGTVDVNSQAGQGTTVRIKIPLTLAIIPALIVTSGGDRYAIPQVSLLELVRLEGEQARRGIELIDGTPVYRLRGNLLPLVDLTQLFASGPASSSPSGLDASAINIVVVQANEQQFGLVVAGINDTEEIVVKPLGKQLKGIPAFSGATIMGDGKVALILDVLGIAQHVSLVSAARERRLVQNAAVREESGARRSLLLCAVGRDGRVAIPLSAVDRLEEFARASFERAGSHIVIQYRGQIMPLLALSGLLPASRRELPDAEGGMQQVVVYREQGRTLGLIVSRVLDIVEESLVIDETAARPGVSGTAVIQGRVTEVLDLPAALRALQHMSPEIAVRAPVESSAAGWEARA